MKCRIKFTGEIVDVFSYGSNGTYTYYVDSCGKTTTSKLNYYKDLEPIVENELTSDIDWENRRYEIAKAAIQAIINIQNYELGWDNNILCSDAINVADELIKQLKSNEAK